MSDLNYWNARFEQLGVFENDFIRTEVPFFDSEANPTWIEKTFGKGSFWPVVWLTPDVNISNHVAYCGGRMICRLPNRKAYFLFANAIGYKFSVDNALMLAPSDTLMLAVVIHKKVKSLTLMMKEAEFKAAGGRGVELADEIDALRKELEQ